MIRRRLGSGLALLALAAVTTAVLLSDRAPDLYGDALRRVGRVARRVRDWSGVDVQRSDVPFGAFQLGHVVLFAGVMLVAGFVLRRRVRPVVLALVVFTLSAGFELVQPVLSRTRHQQVDDLVANGVGIVVGLVVLWLLLRIRRLRRSRSLTW